ncbi:MAG: SDR family oxidoreductase [candidate division WOR-3 bacterium]|nr:SDR family oxidoreductase [candidate division WOR-3 bacterium]
MVVVTGASGGLGSYLVEHLSVDFEVVGTYYSHMPPAIPKAVGFYRVDVTDAECVVQFVNEIAGRLQKVILINLAGISIDGMTHKMSEQVWDRVLDTNLKGAFLMSRSLLRFMREQQWGRIINFSSVVGQIGIPGTVAYSASKAGLFGLTRTMAAENASKNITVNALALGYFEVGMINVLGPETKELVRATIPMKRFGHPSDVERAVRFLIESDYITGSIINMNGGLH